MIAENQRVSAAKDAAWQRGAPACEIGEWTSITLASERLDCSIDPLGAELQRAGGQGWPRLAVGRRPGLLERARAGAVPDRRDAGGRGLSLGGADVIALEKHGFARRRMFTLVERDAASATLRLVRRRGDARGLSVRLRARPAFRARPTALTVTATVRNRGAGPMPFSFGFHPALRWPRGDSGSGGVRRAGERPGVADGRRRADRAARAVAGRWPHAGARRPPVRRMTR